MRKPLKRVYLIALVMMLSSSSAVLAKNSISQMMGHSVSAADYKFLNDFTYANIDSLAKENAQRLKSGELALFLALVPGFIIHGTGHFYAGKPGTGAVLLGMEIISVGLAFGGALSSLPDNSSQGKWDYLLPVGFFLFLGSWVYDIVTSPFRVDEYNQRIKNQQAD